MNRINRRQRQWLKNRFGAKTLKRRLERQERRAEERKRGRLCLAGRPPNILGALVRGVFCATGLYGVGYRQFHDLKVSENTLELRRLPAEFDGFRILHLSDLHLDLDTSLTDTIIRALDGCRYDICVITGDYRNYTVGDPEPALHELSRLMEALPAPVYGVLGNHDNVETVPAMEAMGMRILLNESVAIKRGPKTMYLAGVDDPGIYRTHRLDRALRDIPQLSTVILLSHSPIIYREAAAAGVDLVLAGHLHGGQICLPGGGIILRNDRSPRRVASGEWSEKDTLGYTSRGTGACGVPLRLFCPPEAVVHILRNA